MRRREGAGLSLAVVARIARVTDLAVSKYEREGHVCDQRGRHSEVATSRLDAAYEWLASMPM